MHIANDVDIIGPALIHFPGNPISSKTAYTPALIFFSWICQNSGNIHKGVQKGVKKHQ